MRGLNIFQLMSILYYFLIYSFSVVCFPGPLVLAVCLMDNHCVNIVFIFFVLLIFNKIFLTYTEFDTIVVHYFCSYQK